MVFTWPAAQGCPSYCPSYYDTRTQLPLHRRHHTTQRLAVDGRRAPARALHRLRRRVLQRQGLLDETEDAHGGGRVPDAGAVGGRADLFPRAPVAGGGAECHPDPAKALSDGPNSWPLHKAKALMQQLMDIDAVVKSQPRLEDQLADLAPQP